MTGSIHGNVDGIPLLFLHGGPGYRCDKESLMFFDLKKYKVIFLNQRGSSSSFPAGDISKNTTWDLVNDLEVLRKFLNIKQWEIYGHSWGATLGMVYSIQYPDQVIRLTMTGVFLGRAEDIDWLYNSSKLGSHSPAISHYHQALLCDSVGITNSEDPLSHFKNHLLKDSPNLELAIRWAFWEDINCGSLKDLIIFPKIDDEYIRVAYAISRIEIHYFINNCFLEENWILKNIFSITCPVAIFQGIEDRICPKAQAEAVFNALGANQCQLTLLNETGHQKSVNSYHHLIKHFS